MRAKNPKTIPFTASKYAEMLSEIKKLETERVEVMKRLQAAREMGDLSENGAYKYAKFELADIGRKLRTLKYQVLQGYVPSLSKSSTVQFGTVVKLQGKNKTVTYQMVSEFESNPAQGKLGLTSPLGQLLVGKTVGNRVTLTAPAGTVEYQILEIS